MAQPGVKKPHEIIEISGGAHDRGFQYGSQAKNLIERLVNSHYSYYEKYLGCSKDQVLRDAMKHKPFIEDFSPEIAEEIQGIAEGAELKTAEIIMLCAFLEIFYPRFYSGGGCTSFAVTGSATVNGETYVGQNNDEGVDPWLNGDCSVLIKSKPKSGPSFITYTYAGIPGMMGINSKGIALNLNGLVNQDMKLGMPGLLIAREILSQKNVSDVLGTIINAERANSLNFLIATEDGELFNVEAAPGGYDVFYSSTHLVHTNHFHSMRINVERDYIPESWPDTIFRYNRMNKLLSARLGKIDLEMLMELTKDHVNFPDSICRHVDEEDPHEDRALTTDSMIFVPANKEAWVARGNPCMNAFQKYTLD